MNSPAATASRSESEMPVRRASLASFLCAAVPYASQYDRKEYRIGKSMRNSVTSTETVGYGVHISDITFGKGSSGKIRGTEHMMSCSFVISIIISSFAGWRRSVGLLRSAAAACLFGSRTSDISFNGMGQCVHTGSCRKLWRKSVSDGWLQYRIVWNQIKIVDCIFVMRIGISDHSCKSGLTSGSGSCRNCDQERKLCARSLRCLPSWQATYAGGQVLHQLLLHSPWKNRRRMPEVPDIRVSR